MKITDIKCALFGNMVVVRITTDEGIDGLGQVENPKPYVSSTVPLYRDLLRGSDPTNIEACLMRIRRLGGFKPWGSIVSAIDCALHDITGKAFGIPAYKLLGGKVRDRVRVYNGGIRPKLNGDTPEDYADAMRKMKASPEGFAIIKESLGYHGLHASKGEGFRYTEVRTGPPHPNRGPMTERGISQVVDTVAAIKDVLGDEIGLALDMGPGWMLPDAIRFARAIEQYNVMWVEDMLSGDYVPWVHVSDYAQLTRATTTPTHTGEQIYLAQNFRQLIQEQAVRVIGPDVLDVGGMAELKRVAEFADLYGVLIAPHGIYDGLLGLAAQVHVCATLPDNYIAFEYSVPEYSWWHDIVVGFPDPIVRDGFIEVSDAPGLGVSFDIDAAKRYLNPESADFFDWS